MDTTKKKVKYGYREEVKRDKHIDFCVTPAESELIKSIARQAGLSISNYIRGMALHGKVNTRLNEEEKLFFRNLVAMSNDLHRLVMRARENELPEMMSCFQTCRDRLAPLLKKLKL